MALTSKYFKALLMLLAFSISTCETEFKNKFGEEFGTALKRYNAEMTQAHLDQFTEFYKTLLRDLNATTEQQRNEQERVFKYRMEQIKLLKSEIGDSITAQSLGKSKRVISTILFEILDFYRSPYIANDKEKSKIIADGLRVCNTKEEESARILHQKMSAKWREMYKTIPAEELHKHPEYAQINELMEKSSEKHLELVNNIAQILRKLTDFFNYEEYKFLFRKQQV